MPRRLVSLVEVNGKLYAGCDDGSIFEADAHGYREQSGAPQVEWLAMSPIPGTEADPETQTEVIDG